MTRIISIIIVLGTLIFSSCGNEQGPRFKVKAKALGIMNDIVIVCDQDLWKGPTGDTIDQYYGGFYPLTPSPEPIFDLRHFTLAELNAQPLRKELRTYVVIADLTDELSETAALVKKDLGAERFQRALSDDDFHTSVGKDKWASGQLVIYVFGKNKAALHKAIAETFDGVSARINDFDSYQLSQKTYSKGENLGLARITKERFGANIIFPTDYSIALDMETQSGLLWLRKNISYRIGRDANPGSMNIGVTLYDYTGPEMLTNEAVKARFNALGAHVSSSEPNTFAIINDVDLPIFSFDRSISGHFTKEYRGIWEMENDFMGGPFQSYAIVNTDTNQLLSIDAFIYAPGKSKRDLMQQIDTVVKRIQW